VYPEWPRTVMAALRSSMTPAGVEGNRYLYRPRAAGDPTAQAACLQAADRLRP
jgi:hypothetical protein